MKIVNYNRGFISLFECVIHGTIYMTFKEWQAALKYVSDNRGELDPYGGSLAWDTFVSDTVRGYSTKTHGYHNVRVTATNMIVRHFAAKNKAENYEHYKKANYQIAIEKERT